MTCNALAVHVWSLYVHTMISTGYKWTMPAHPALAKCFHPILNAIKQLAMILIQSSWCKETNLKPRQT
jgi:hypothetical protein